MKFLSFVKTCVLLFFIYTIISACNADSKPVPIVTDNSSSVGLVFNKFHEFDEKKLSKDELKDFLENEIKVYKQSLAATKKEVKEFYKKIQGKHFDFSDYTILKQYDDSQKYENNFKQINSKPDLSKYPEEIQSKAYELWGITREILKLSPCYNANPALMLMTLPDKEVYNFNCKKTELFEYKGDYLVVYEVTDKTYAIQMHGSIEKGWLPLKIWVLKHKEKNNSLMKKTNS